MPEAKHPRASWTSRRATLWCPVCARPVADPLTCGDCSAVICRVCGTPLESADELAFGLAGMPAPTRPTPPRLRRSSAPANPLVAHHWILAGIGVMVLASLVAIYFAIGLLFWQGQWQLIFHPSHIVASTPASEGMAFDDVRFDATETGHTRLTGWWIPAVAGVAAAASDSLSA